MCSRAKRKKIWRKEQKRLAAIKVVKENEK